MKEYAVENNLLKQPRRMLISTVRLENGAIITPLINFYIRLGLTSLVDVRSGGEENPDSNVVAETMKLLGL